MTEVNERLGDHYRVVAIRRGGMGEVYICDFVGASDNEEVKGRVALKTFQRRFFFDSATRLAFVREATTWLRLTGIPFIMPALGVEQIGDRPFVRMLAIEWGPNGEHSLADRLAQGPLEVEEALEWAFQLAFALREGASRIPGLVHGDLKPDNVLIQRSGVALLTDFGLAQAVSLGHADVRLASAPAYRAPELWSSESVTPSVATDVYAFGVMLHEMLTGETPVTARLGDAAGWAAAHGAPRTNPWSSKSGLARDAMALAIACQHPRPTERPRDFGDVFARINRMMSEHDPVLHLGWMARAVELRDSFREIATEMRDARVHGLLSMQEPAQALAELDEVNAADYDAELWKLRGTALSLLNRDAEALPCFERALEGELSADSRTRYESEYALSLKRVGRFDEARTLYDRLLMTADEEHVPMIVVNLATVMIEQEQWDDARRLLEQFTRTHPHVPAAWGNLGSAFAQLQEFEKAERSYLRALQLEPQNGQIRLLLAALYMDHVGRIDLAWSALDTAFDSGYHTHDLIVRLLTCAILLGRQGDGAAIYEGLRRNTSEQVAKEVLDDAVQKAESLVQKFGPDARRERVVPGDLKETDAIGDVPAPGSEREPLVGSPETGIDAEPTRARLPFLNFRFYEQLDFTIDYYQFPDAPQFVDQFLGEWRRAQRDPRLAMGGSSLRGSPFFFTRCRNCGVFVLTNRDAGKRTNCRMCDTPFPAKPLNDPHLLPLVDRISEVMGISPATKAETVHVLLLQVPDSHALDELEGICAEAGMTRAAQRSQLAMHMLQEGASRGFELTAPWSVWLIAESEREAWSKTATPRVIVEVVRELQRAVPHVHTMSTTIDAASASALEATVEDMFKQVEDAARRKVHDGTAEASDYCELAQSALFRSSFGDAQSMARIAVALDDGSARGWELLGQALFRLEHFGEASAALEKSLALEPASAMNTFLLAFCWERLGHQARADDLRAKARTMGDPQIAKLMERGG